MKHIYFVLLLFVISMPGKAQFDPTKATVHGNFEVDLQTYQEDNGIGISEAALNGKYTGINGFGNIIYRYGDFSAGLRYEAYLPPLNGFDEAYEGQGIAHRYVNYKSDFFDITAGNFYGQFGNGLVFRAYEDWNLGIDNALDGIKIVFHPAKGLTLKGVYGTQRYYWVQYENKNRGIVRGIDGEWQLNELSKKMQQWKTRIRIGGSFVSKYEKDDPFSEWKLPENVGAWSARLNLQYGQWNLQSEYARKINDPNSVNHYIFKPGEACWISGSYSRKGLGVLLSGKRIDNFSFNSMRQAPTGTPPAINFLPPLTYQHTYALAAMYPYSTQPNGEMGWAAEIFYTIPRKTTLGGKYGTRLSLNYSRMTGLEKNIASGDSLLNQPGTTGYESPFFSVGDNKYFEDLSFKIEKKASRKIKLIAGFTHIDYNMEVIEENIESGHLYYRANIGILDLTYKLDRKKSLRTELQYLATRQDSGNWVAALIEYSMAPKWFFAVQDQYNFKNPETDNTYHYYMMSVAYVHKSSRLAVSYGRQREGVLCVGGVCRQVPAASGFNITLTSNF
jgi:hypothetical protein